jgi:signal transduction histidine kinase/CheY-like chemotaxis protein
MATSDQDSARVLVLAPIGRDGPVSADLLCRFGLCAEVCRDLTGLLTKIEAGAAAAFIAEEGLFGKDMSGLFDWVKRQPPWSDLPFIVLTSHLGQAAVTLWRQKLVETLRNVALLERPVHAITLTSTVQAAVRARMRQYELRMLLEARERTAHELEALVQLRTSALEDANRALQAQMAERARIEESLRRAQKIEAIGQLTGGVAHDFNNLLMVISAGLDMLDRRIDAARLQRIKDGMRQATMRGAGLTRQLLAFSRRQSLKPEAVDLARQIDGLRELLDRSLRGDVHVELEFATDLWPIEVDPGELELVVLNLALNARDAMPNGGTIVIRADNAPGWQDGDLAGDFVNLSVIDTGTGMTQEVKAHLFEPFFTTKEVGKGSGLGLAQAYGFARQSGGGIQIKSEVGQGTTVTLHLPRSSKIPAADQRQPATLHDPRPARNAAGAVLLVEDDDEVAALVAEMLVQLGYDVMRAASGAAALGALANERHFDIVFSDIVMPGGMNGIDLAREVRARRPDLAVLLTSGQPGPGRRSAEAEGFRVLLKPYRLDDLAMALAHAHDGTRAARA